MQTLYARKEWTVDSNTLAQGSKLSLSQRDVFLYSQDGYGFVSRYPWWHGRKPDKRHRYIMHNCHRYRLEWLPDAV